MPFCCVAIRYGLRESEAPASLLRELDGFYKWMTEERYGLIEPPIRPCTAKTYLTHVRLALGWVQTARPAKSVELCGAIEEHLSLRHLMPTDSTESAEIIFDFLQYLKKTRGISSSYESNMIRGLVKLAKHMYCPTDTSMTHGHHAPMHHAHGNQYDAIPLIKILRSFHKQAMAKSSKATHVADEEKKWVDWPQVLEVVDHLKQEATRLTDSKGKPRSPLAIAESQQRYLMIGILTCVPDRQRTLRELEIGRTLIKHTGGADNGTHAYSYSWVIKHGAEDYKTGNTYGQRPLMKLDHLLYPTLELFIKKYRSHLNPVDDHSFLFCGRNGEPITRQGIYHRITRSMYRHAGKRMNPHLFRDSIVTYLRQSNSSERDLESLALYMGHSLQTQKTNYDRRSSSEKVAPAIEMIRDINRQCRANARTI